MRSGITAPGSGITTLGIGISSVFVYSHPPTKRIVTAGIWKNKMKTFKSWLHQKWCRSLRIVNQQELQLLVLAN